MSKRKTNEEFIEEIYTLVGDEYTVLGKYTGYSEKVKIRHNTCGFEYDVAPHRFKGGNRCRKCRGRSQRKTNEEFLEEVHDLVGKEYTFIDEYKTAVKSLKVRHNICNREYYVTPNNFLGGNRCGNCSIKRRAENNRKTNEEFTLEVYDLVGNDYTFLEDYIHTEKNILCRHNACGNEWSIRPSNFLNGTRCPQCKNLKPRLTQDEFEQRVYALVGDEYSVLGKYRGHKNRVLMKHNECGHEYTVISNTFLSGRRCPVCVSPRGERRIRKYLKSKGINFKEEQTFEDLKYIKSLRYDFSILDEDGNVKKLIEFDGEQHTRPITFFGGEEQFKLTQKRDRLKDKYAKENNIPLLRIPYKDIDIVETIVEDFLERKT